MEAGSAAEIHCAVPPGLGRQRASRADWIHELKWGGYRIIARKEGSSVRLWSRTGRGWHPAFPGIVEAIAALPATSLILDGEAVTLRNDGSDADLSRGGAVELGTRDVVVVAILAGTLDRLVGEGGQKVVELLIREVEGDTDHADVSGGWCVLS